MHFRDFIIFFRNLTHIVKFWTFDYNTHLRQYVMYKLREFNTHTYSLRFNRDFFFLFCFFAFSFCHTPDKL